MNTINTLRAQELPNLLYLEGSCLSAVQGRVKEISDAYAKRLKQNQKCLKKMPHFFLYDYRPPLEVNAVLSGTPLANPAIQPHDSKLFSVLSKEDSLMVKGTGFSYMNHIEYSFDMSFSQTSELQLKHFSYNKLSERKEADFTFAHLNEKLGNVIFRDVFLEKTEKLENKITFAFLQYIEEDEGMDIFLLAFNYEDVKVNCVASNELERKATSPRAY